MPLPIKEEIPRCICADHLHKKLRSIGLDTDGYEYSLENILKVRGFGLPTKEDNMFGFMVNFKYTKLYLNYADALAHEILFLNELGILNRSSNGKSKH